MPSVPQAGRSRLRRFRIAPWLAGLLLLTWAFGAPLLPPEGPSLLSVEAPVAGATVGPEGLEVLVRFTPGRAASETFRVLLNGAEVTEELTTGENGAWGRLYGLLDGENVLRVEVFGRVWTAGDRLVEQAREVRVRARRPLDLHRG